MVDILDVKFKKLPYEAHKARGESFGKIGFIYEATVTIKIDTDGIANYLKSDSKIRETLESQNRGLQETIVKTNKELDNIQRNSINAKTKAEQNKVKSDLNKSYKEILANQKLEEGNKLYYQKNYQDAINKYNEGIQLNPNLLMAYNNRGATYNYLKNYEQAIDNYNKAIKINPNLAEVYFNRGITLSDL